MKNGIINVFCRLESSYSMRKVGAIQGAILPNGKGPQPADTASATENNRQSMLQALPVRVKMWGKSPRYYQVTGDMGKPYGLKDQIYPEIL